MESKRCGLYIRVSTIRQTKVEEGSLKVQQESLERYVEMKNTQSGEKWKTAGIYIDKGISGKDTNRPEYKRMLEDIKIGRINTVLCTALSRISRSTKDLLSIVETFNAQGVGFICLKANVDTSTSHGKLFLTIMAALCQFERELTSERTSTAVFSRAHKGLWNGGQLLGFDLDPDKKGYLIPNRTETQIVNFIFDTYLSNGSVLKTAEIANLKGYAPKRYVSVRSEKLHESKEFSYSSVLSVLINRAYIGEKEVNKKIKNKDQGDLPENKRYAICKAVWKPIIAKDKFNRVQELLKINLKHKNNGAKPTKHTYLFNGGFLHCHKCGTRMEGRNAHGHTKAVYHYYYCVNKDCRFRISERELELSVQKLIKMVANDPIIFGKIAENLNKKLKEQLPYLKKRKEALHKELSSLEAEANQIISNFMSLKNGREFIDGRLGELKERKDSLENHIQEVGAEIKRLEKQSIEEHGVKKLLASFDEIFKNHLKPYQKRKLLQWLLHHVKIGNDKLKIGIESNAFKSDITSLLRADGVFETNPGSQ